MHIDSTDTTLKRYLEDIRRTAPLSREEEQILFQKAKEGDKIPWRRKWQPTPVPLLGESHGWKSLVG